MSAGLLGSYTEKSTQTMKLTLLHLDTAADEHRWDSIDCCHLKRQALYAAAADGEAGGETGLLSSSPSLRLL